MFQLLKIEWLKIKHYRAFWLLSSVFLILYPLTLFIGGYKFNIEITNAKGFEGGAIRTLVGSPFLFPKIWQSAAWFGGMFFIAIGMLFIMFITNEVQYRTQKQNIIDGWSRADYLKAKLSLLLAFSIVATVIVFIIGLISGMMFSPASSYSTLLDESYYVLYFFLMCVIYLLIAFFIAILIKRTGVAIIVYFGLVCIIDNLLWTSLTFQKNQLGYFLPFEVVDSLIPNPFSPSILKGRKFSDLYLVGATIAYFGLWWYFIKKRFIKSDLKN